MATPPAPASPAVRDRLAEALALDLVGPGPDDPLAAERLPGRERPSNWYLTGFLVPSGLPPERCADADEDDDFDAEVPGRPVCSKSRAKTGRRRSGAGSRRRSG